MRYIFSITLLLLVLLHSLSYAQDQEISKRAPEKKAEASFSSSDWANKALKLYNTQSYSEGILAVEKSLALNPYQPQAFQLRSKIYDQLPYTSHKISSTTFVFSFIPKWVTLGLGLLFFFWLMKSSGHWINSYRNYVLVADKVKLHTFAAAFLTLTLFFTYFMHIQATEQAWLCLTQEQTSLHSAPSKKANILRTFTAGSCFVPLETSQNWISVDAGDSSGWLPSESLTHVRGAL